MYALVDSDFEEESRKRGTVARWKGYVRLSDVSQFRFHSPYDTAADTRLEGRAIFRPGGARK